MKQKTTPGIYSFSASSTYHKGMCLQQMRIGMTFAASALLLLLAVIPLNTQPQLVDSLPPPVIGSLAVEQAGLTVAPAGLTRSLPETSYPASLTAKTSACSSGCAASSPLPPKLSVREIESLLARFAKEPIKEGSVALETLLFHGTEVREFLVSWDAVSLDRERLTFLKQELSRTHAWISVRLVDEHGVERFRLGPHRIPLGVKQHLNPDRAIRLPPPDISGTVKRVGLHHLWARI